VTMTNRVPVATAMMTTLIAVSGTGNIDTLVVAAIVHHTLHNCKL
jgi:hypothetical protein